MVSLTTETSSPPSLLMSVSSRSLEENAISVLVELPPVEAATYDLLYAPTQRFEQRRDYLPRDLPSVPLPEVALDYTGCQVAAHAVHTPTWWRR
jgi:hypothetical protein